MGRVTTQTHRHSTHPTNTPAHHSMVMMATTHQAEAGDVEVKAADADTAAVEPPPANMCDNPLFMQVIEALPVCNAQCNHIRVEVHVPHHALHALWLLAVAKDTGAVVGLVTYAPTTMRSSLEHDKPWLYSTSCIPNPDGPIMGGFVTRRDIVRELRTTLPRSSTFLRLDRGVGDGSACKNDYGNPCETFTCRTCAQTFYMVHDPSSFPRVLHRHICVACSVRMDKQSVHDALLHQYSEDSSATHSKEERAAENSSEEDDT